MPNPPSKRPDAASVIERQRERERQIREHGFDVVRYGWRLARYDRPRLADRFRGVMATRSPRLQRYPWYRETRTYRQAA